MRFVAALIASILFAAQAGAVNDSNKALYATLGRNAEAPLGWTTFCKENPGECMKGATKPRDIVMSDAAWRDLNKVNDWVNENIKWKNREDVVEHWTLPSDGHGDYEAHMLLKRKMLIDAGWPPDALLATVVLGPDGHGRGVLTVKTNKGEYVLDHDIKTVVPWTRTGYRFRKRQSQADPNVWENICDDARYEFKLGC